MNAELPAALSEAIARELDGVSGRALNERATQVSERYRRGDTSAKAIADGEDALAYALARAPATYAACAAAFARGQAMAPDFAPRRLLDAGAGPGGASWAALERWPSLEHVRMIDASPPFLALARRLAGSGSPALQAAEITRRDLLAADPFPVADLVVASYALAELGVDAQAQAVAALWDACAGLLVLVEPGTPQGFERIRAARASLIATGVAIAAPCPHNDACPMVEPDWCHFVQRLPRSRAHRLAKGADAPFEDEKFAYVVAARPTVRLAARSPRVLARPRHLKPGVELKLCTAGDVEHRFVPRRDKAAYRAVRHIDWGDPMPGDD
ncbi:small ribosomal subunit Rsm22 family protein [Phenylobacterium sp.]|uniref:small ribosomal subunit Rsm22 family protein n=1 Tax=Phenylobacterium sp. TaxID=1871053 RepID=UPI002734B879|nr:small ribosomal subunit Rsm22 family protein [Phenylobacterium sp.]MDP3660656.1 small ribosomal subunit Rsm22 family protein [Phenylobacterium sp.]